MSKVERTTTRRRWAALGALAATLGVHAAVLAGEQPVRLEELQFAAGSRLAATGDGRLVTVERGSWRLSLWSQGGAPSLHASLPISPDAVLRSLAVRPPRALLAVVDPARPGLTGVLVDLADGAVRRRFEVPVFPASVFAGPTGFVVQEVSFAERSQLFHLEDDGLLGAAVPTSDAVWQRALELGSPSAALLELVVAGGRLWGLPLGFYELWDLSPQRLAVSRPPAQLALVGHLLTPAQAQEKAARRWGEEGRGLVERVERAARPPALAAPSPDPPSTPASPAGLRPPGGSFFPAVLSASADGPRIAVLLDVEPARSEGGCRLDLWEVGEGPSLSRTAPLPGPCPLRIALAGERVWVYHANNRVTSLAVAAIPEVEARITPAPRAETKDQAGNPRKERN